MLFSSQVSEDADDGTGPCGASAVSTRSSGRDGIVADGESGFLAPLGGPDALAHRLARLYTEPVLNPGEGAKRASHYRKALRRGRWHNTLAAARACNEAFRGRGYRSVGAGDVASDLRCVAADPMHARFGRM